MMIDKCVNFDYSNKKLIKNKFRITPIIWFGGLYQEPKFLLTKKMQPVYVLRKQEFFY